MTTLASSALRPVSLWRDAICPKEHGSWSLAFEPLALGLLVAPSAAGALLVVSLAGGFFARRPLRLAWLETKIERRAAGRRALAACIAVSALAFAGAVALGGLGWLVWLLPLAATACGFAYFDFRGAGREEAAEIVGAAAFAFSPAALAALAGWSPAEAASLALVALGRSVPSVLCVRAFLRGVKTGVRRDAPALIAAASAAALSVVLFGRSLVPGFAVVALFFLCARAVALLAIVRPTWRARTVGMVEAIFGLLFVASLALTWRG